MANVLTTNPIQIDTAGTIFAKGKPYTINRVSYQAAADDEDVQLTDTLGNIVWQAKAGDVSVDGYNYGEILDYTSNEGLICSVIDGTGVLLIFV